jgi:hypothetical protein
LMYPFLLLRAADAVDILGLSLPVPH